MAHEKEERAAYDYFNPVKVDRDPAEDWTVRDHDGMDTEFEAEPPMVKATRVWDGVVVANRG
jgi:hypothetical protein